MISLRAISVLLYLLLAPLAGGLLEGMDRKITARMQRRVGPPLLQPFYDVAKLLHKEPIAVTITQRFLMLSYLILVMFSGGMFFYGSDLLMCILMLSTASLFLYLAGCVTSSPYSSIGAQRELLQEMAYEPALLLLAVGFYLSERSFNVRDIIQVPQSAILYLPGFFVAFLFVLTIKMRKSPFDESTSHHAHQELVKGITTEMGAKNLAFFQITEWYETILMLGFLALFIVNKNPVSCIFAVLFVLAAYFLEILIDNTSARLKTGKMLFLSWVVTIAAAGTNLLILMLVR